ncbi:hypothetical protein J4411_03085 [Candidatus Pacearchaeota archaeon]|nr:hypothetical protein [Candidatus Pacearchaeota archaeon]
MRKKWIFVVLLVILVWALYFFIFRSAGLIKLSTSCPDGIIPDRFNLNHFADTNYWGLPNYYQGADYLPKWEDGTSVDMGWFQGSCHLGNKEGENVNYIYCSKIPYRKTSVSSDGTIGEPINLYIDLVLNSKDGVFVEQDLSGIGNFPRNISSFKILDYSCKT